MRQVTPVDRSLFDEIDTLMDKVAALDEGWLSELQDIRRFMNAASWRGRLADRELLMLIGKSARILNDKARNARKEIEACN